MKNQTLKANLLNLENTLEKFVNGSKNLDVILGRQMPKHDRSGLGYQSSYSKVEVPSCPGVTYNYGTGTPRVSNALVAFEPRKMAKVGSSRGSFMSKFGTHYLWIPKQASFLGY